MIINPCFTEKQITFKIFLTIPINHINAKKDKVHANVSTKCFQIHMRMSKNKEHENQLNAVVVYY